MKRLKHDFVSLGMLCLWVLPTTHVLAWTVDEVSLGMGVVQLHWQEPTSVLHLKESGQGPALLWAAQGQVGDVGPVTLRWRLSGQLHQLGTHYEGYRQLADGSAQAWSQTNAWQAWGGMAKLDAVLPVHSQAQLVLIGALDTQRQSRNLLQYTEQMTRHTALGGLGWRWQATTRWGAEVEVLQSVSGSGRLTAPALAFGDSLSVRQFLRAAQAYWRVADERAVQSGQWVLRWEQRRTTWRPSDEVGGFVFPGAHDRQVTWSLQWQQRW